MQVASWLVGWQVWQFLAARLPGKRKVGSKLWIHLLLGSLLLVLDLLYLALFRHFTNLNIRDYVRWFPFRLLRGVYVWKYGSLPYIRA